MPRQPRSYTMKMVEDQRPGGCFGRIGKVLLIVAIIIIVLLVLGSVH